MLPFAFHYEYKDGTSQFREYLFDHSSSAWLYALRMMHTVDGILRCTVIDEDGVQITELYRPGVYVHEGV